MSGIPGWPARTKWWEKFLCTIGLHKWETIFGWHEHLDDPSKSGYYGQAWCPRCGFAPSEENS